MRVPPATLARALAASLLLHAGLLELAGTLMPSARRAPHRLLGALDVRLREEPLELQVTPPAARLRIEPSRHASAAPAAPAAPRVLLAPQRDVAAARRDHRPRSLAGAAADAAYEQMRHALYYPREAVERGLQGEATVLIFLDEGGNVIAARLERSSGHALLDDAAVRAARALRALPASAPREALLPVRFTLR